MHDDMKFKRTEGWKVAIIILAALGLFYWLLGPHAMRTDNVLKDASTMIERHEGYEDKVYPDSRDVPTIGIGFNLYSYDARKRIEAFGLNFDNILAGKASLTDKQIRHLFKQDVKTARNDAEKFLPNFDKQPNEIKIVLIDMSFNLGYNRLMQFVKFRQALIDRDYVKAAWEMVDSRWYRQVGNRSKELTGIVIDISATQTVHYISL
jgi:GH24 family phage-related lysozyme (muramidase)